MHESGSAADESFVNFDFAALPAHLHKRIILHCQTDAMKHEPCRLLSDAEIAGDFVGTDSILAIGDHPNGDKPLIQRDRGIFKDSPDLDAELPMVMDALALPLVLVGEEHYVFAPASRALDTIGPAHVNHVSKAIAGFGEVDDGLLECFWLFHNDSYTTLHALIRQLYYCPSKTRDLNPIRMSTYEKIMKGTPNWQHGWRRWPPFRRPATECVNVTGS
jgi:hypothetical protein